MEAKQQTTLIAVVGVIVAAVLVWVGVNRRQRLAETPSPSPSAEAFKPSEPVKVGWMGPLSGDAASYGQSIKRGVELAHKEFGQGKIELVFEDTKCEGKNAVSGITKLVTTDRVQAVIGEVCSGATLPAAPVAEEKKVVLISAASTSPKITEAGAYIWRTVPSDALQGEFGANLVYTGAMRKLAILYSNEEYGVGFTEVLKKSFTQLGGEVVASEAFARGAKDVRTQLTKVKRAAPDAIYVISNSPDAAVAALKQIKELAISATVFGSEGLKSPDIVKGAKEAAEGLIVSSVSSGTSDFVDTHKREYGEEPGPFAAQGYDAYLAILRAIETGATTGAAIKDALAKVEFDGASGHIKFNADGDVAGNYDVTVIRNGTFERES